MEEIEHRWFYALSAPVAALNGASYTSAIYFDDDREFDLEESWGLGNRQQLLDILAMADKGDATQLNNAYWHYQRMLPSQWQALLNQRSPRERILYEYASRTFLDCGFGGTRAWDLGRMSFLLRCGVRKQWISLEESLWLHWRLALRARHYYDSWSTYLAGFIFGRALWNCSEFPDEHLGRQLERQGSESANKWLVSNLTSAAEPPLDGLPWELPLTSLEYPESLEQGTWS